MSRESESLLPVVWWPKGWSAGSDRGLSNKVEERVFPEVSFPIAVVSRLQSVLLKIFISLECTDKITLPAHD